MKFAISIGVIVLVGAFLWFYPTPITVEEYRCAFELPSSFYYDSYIDDSATTPEECEESRQEVFAQIEEDRKKAAAAVKEIEVRCLPYKSRPISELRVDCYDFFGFEKSL